MTTLNRRKVLALMGATIAAGGLSAPALAMKKKIKGWRLALYSHREVLLLSSVAIFADAGLDVEFKFFQAAQPMAVAIASGDIDYAVTAMSGGLISLADKGAIRVIGGALSEEAGIDGQKYLVSDAAFQAGGKDAKSFRGKRFAVTQAGSSFHYMGSKMAKAEGIEMSFTPLQKSGGDHRCMKSGQVDGWSIVRHIAKPLASSGKVHIIGNVAITFPIAR